jgi:hypothetical protein
VDLTGVVTLYIDAVTAHVTIAVGVAVAMHVAVTNTLVLLQLILAHTRVSERDVGRDTTTAGRRRRRGV